LDRRQFVWSRRRLVGRRADGLVLHRGLLERLVDLLRRGRRRHVEERVEGSALACEAGSGIPGQHCCCCCREASRARSDDRPSAFSSAATWSKISWSLEAKSRCQDGTLRHRSCPGVQQDELSRTYSLSQLFLEERSDRSGRARQSRGGFRKGERARGRSLELVRDARVDRAQAGDCKQQEMEQLHPGWKRLRMWRSGQERWLVVVKVRTAGQVRWPARPR
jgi:hypothetical protein